MKFKKVVATVMAAAMMVSASAISVSADTAAPTTDGTYTADVIMHKDGSTDDSMCAPFFNEKADVVISGDTAKVSVYLLNDVPNYPKSTWGYDQPVEQVKAQIDGTEYAATVSEDTVSKVYAKTGAFPGTVAGTAYDCNVVTLEIPTTALLNDVIDVNAFVACVMKTTVDFDMVLSNYEVVGGSDEDTDEPATENKKESTVTARVLANETTFEVTVPEAISMGDLSVTEDTTVDFNVDVTMEKGNDGKVVTVVADENGKLVCGENEIAFTNDFGSKDFSVAGSETGTLTVKADDVKAAPAGDYEGTVSFVIEAK